MRNKLKDLPVRIYWFSGCGNTLLIAMEMEKYLRDKGREAGLIPLEKARPESIDQKAIIGFAVPVAGQGTYPFIWDFIENLPRSSGTPVFLVDTLGYYSGGILGPIKKILKRNGYLPLAAKEIIMPNVFQKAKFAPKKDEKKIVRGKEKAKRFCDKLLAGGGHWRDIPGYSRLMSSFFRTAKALGPYRKLFPMFIDPETCRKCGLCVELCPAGHLTMSDKNSVPVQGDSCVLCNRCFAFCPAEAIRFGKKQKIRYHAVPLGELRRRLGGVL